MNINENWNNKFKWCFEQKQGLKLIEPNDNLALEYFKNAEETLKVLNKTRKLNSNMWLATQKYYVEYFCAYSILMRIGIKSEIHSCTINIIELLEELKIINFDFHSILERDKELRIENQYYLKNIKVEINYNELRELVLKCKQINDNFKKDKIIEIRNIFLRDLN